LLVVRRHLQVFIRISDRLDQQSLVRLAWNDGRSVVAPLQDPIARVEKQPAFELFGILAMALIAILDKNRPNLFLEKFNARGVRACGIHRKARESDQNYNCAIYKL